MMIRNRFARLLLPRNPARAAYMVMRRVVLIGALQLLACHGDGEVATVGVLGKPCVASAEVDSCGASQACGADGRCTPAGDVLVTPTVEPLSETSARITWTAPKGAVSWYEVRVAPSPTDAATAVPGFAHVSAGPTSVVLSALAPGTLERVVVAAVIPASAPAAAPSSLLWTPYGAINEDSVSSVTPLTGYAGAPYAEAMFVSSHFSIFFATRVSEGGLLRIRRHSVVPGRETHLWLRRHSVVRRRQADLTTSPARSSGMRTASRTPMKPT